MTATDRETYSAAGDFLERVFDTTVPIRRQQLRMLKQHTLPMTIKHSNANCLGQAMQNITPRPQRQQDIHATRAGLDRRRKCFDSAQAAIGEILCRTPDFTVDQGRPGRDRDQPQEASLHVPAACCVITVIA
jgi:hypothetical protein